MSTQSRRQGQPLIVFGVILMGWVTLRAAFWSVGFAGQTPVLAGEMDEPLPIAELVETDRSNPVQQPSASVHDRADEARNGARQHYEDEWISAPILERPEHESWIRPASATSALATDAQTADNPQTRSATAASHNLLWMAAMAHVPLPQSVQDHLTRSSGDGAESGVSNTKIGKSGESRFGVDSWLFLRQDGSALTAGGLRAPSYGRSQAGAVLRYRLKPNSSFQPGAYLRVTQALAGPKDRDIALGLSARPFGAVPLTVHAEARLSEQSSRTDVRPAAFVTTGGEKRDLPFGVSVRGYAQAGYVGGDLATAFADGSIVGEREIARFDLGSVKAGAGAWGGAQEGATRLDVGPTANVTVRLGEVPARLSLDYRVRVAGDAEPGSGAALTLSTGF